MATDSSQIDLSEVATEDLISALVERGEFGVLRLGNAPALFVPKRWRGEMASVLRRLAGQFENAGQIIAVVADGGGERQPQQTNLIRTA